jgi:PAS domain S-box-containing protein
MIKFLKRKRIVNKKYFIVFVLLGFSALISAQTSIDSLKSILLETPEMDKPIVLIKLSEIYLSVDSSKSIENANQALNLSIKTKNELLKAKSLLNLGKVYCTIKDYEIAKLNYLSSLKTFQGLNDFWGISENYFHLGDVYLETTNYDSSIYYYQKSYGIKKDIEDYKSISLIEQKLALAYLRNGDSQKVEEYILNSLNSVKDTLVKEEKTIPIIKQEKWISFFKTDKSNNKILQIILYIGLGIILIITGLLYYFYNEKLKSTKVLLAQNQKILKQNQEIKSQTEHLTNVNVKLEKLSIVASKTDNAIIIANPSGSIDWINESYTRLYGFTLKELLIEKGSTYTETSSNPGVENIFNKAITGKETQIYESDIISRNGKNYRIQTTLTPVLNDKKEVIYLVAIDSDVTKLKDIENQLQKLIITKDRFFSIIAHDLKNPFNNIMGISQLLVQGFERMKHEKVKYFHKGLYEISKNGYELLINLLEWARSQKGAIEFEPTTLNLFKLGEETFSLYQIRANQKEITFTNQINNDFEIFADINMIKTILRNLVSNALKFTDRGGAIEIFAESFKNYVQIIIRDTGIGIEPKAANNLFKIDEYISTEGTENETGTGLGLILCKEFVDKHNGNIWVESKLGFGSKFNFTLPKRNDKNTPA